MANHLTPTELAELVKMERQDVIAKCMQHGIPIFEGKIDKTLFITSMKQGYELSQQKNLVEA